MATCSTSALLISAVANFGNLSPNQVRVAKFALLRSWLLAVNDSADVTLAGLMERGKIFGMLSEKQQRTVKLQFLCELADA